MPNVIITPNMNLPSPVPGVDPGIDYAVNNQSCLTLIDQHDHSPGFGVQINPAGIDINADLPLNSNNLTLVRSVRFDAQSAPLALVTDLSCLYSVTETGSNGDLWYNDASGNQIQMTKNGAVLATISALVSGNNIASWTANQLTVYSDGTSSPDPTPGNIVAGSLLMGNNSASTEYLTLQPPNAMGTSYTVTLPPPNSSGSTAILTYDTSNDILVGPSLSSITTGVNPAGALVMYGGTSAPTGYLLCDGTSYLRATYPILFTAIGTAYGTADGTHFNVPDMRGMFPRGTDNGAGNDPDASSRTAANPGGNTGDNVGSFESWATETHHHQVTNYANTNPGGGVTQATITVGAGVANTTNNTGQFSTETRPINVYVNFIIKT